MRARPYLAVHNYIQKTFGIVSQEYLVDSTPINRITAGDNKTPEYTKMNPFQKVPVLLDGDFALTESVAMFR